MAGRKYGIKGNLKGSGAIETVSLRLVSTGRRFSRKRAARLRSRPGRAAEKTNHPFRIFNGGTAALAPLICGGSEGRRPCAAWETKAELGAYKYESDNPDTGTRSPQKEGN